MGQMRRLLGERPAGVDRANSILRRAVSVLRPEGRPLYAGLLSLGIPDDPLFAVWRTGDMLREFRGDCHTAAWISMGIDATEIGLMSELYWGLPMRTYSRTRAWTDAEFDAAEARLSKRGWVRDGALTDAGRAAREAIEVTTDSQMVPALDAIGSDLAELVSILEPWGATIRAGRGYPANGPHDLAQAAKK